MDPLQVGGSAARSKGKGRLSHTGVAELNCSFVGVGIRSLLHIVSSLDDGPFFRYPRYAGAHFTTRTETGIIIQRTDQTCVPSSPPCQVLSSQLATMKRLQERREKEQREREELEQAALILGVGFKILKSSAS